MGHKYHIKNMKSLLSRSFRDTLTTGVSSGKNQAERFGNVPTVFMYIRLNSHLLGRWQHPVAPCLRVQPLEEGMSNNPPLHLREKLRAAPISRL